MGCAMLAQPTAAPSPQRLPAVPTPGPLRLVHAAEPAGFAELERLAVLIGARDPLPGAGLVARWLRGLFDLSTPRPLADPRLEALRRLVLALRRGTPAEATGAALRAGVTPGQVDLLTTRYAAPRRG